MVNTWHHCHWMIIKTSDKIVSIINGTFGMTSISMIQCKIDIYSCTGYLISSDGQRKYYKA